METLPASISAVDDDPFGALLAQALKDCGYTNQADFGSQIGVSRPLISAIINGHSPVPLKRLDTIISVLGALSSPRLDELRFAAYWSHTPRPMRALLISSHTS